MPPGGTDPRADEPGAPGPRWTHAGKTTKEDITQTPLAEQRCTLPICLAAAFGGTIVFCNVPAAQAGAFSYDPIHEEDIVSAMFSADFASLVAHRTVLDVEVNHLELVDLTGGSPIQVGAVERRISPQMGNLGLT